MRYQWDQRKNRTNRRKHDGISFELAALVFDDENCLITPDRADPSGEQRWHAIGAAQVDFDVSVILLVLHAYREESDGEEIIRLISARRAEKH